MSVMSFLVQILKNFENPLFIGVHLKSSCQQTAATFSEQFLKGHFFLTLLFQPTELELT